MLALYSRRRAKSTLSYNRACGAASPESDDCLSPLIPLFPLDVVLFPSTPLPLHIFEPRYKEMIGECLAQGTQFGVVRVEGDSVAPAGCTAEIITVTKEYPDGRMDIITEGRRRFEIVEVNQTRSFLQAEILYFEDEPGAPAKDAVDRAVQLHAEILGMAGAVQDLSAADPKALSFYLAGSLPLDLDFKQKLLGLRTEDARISAIIEYLEEVVPKIKTAARARQKAGGNGHVH